MDRDKILKTVWEEKRGKKSISREKGVTLVISLPTSLFSLHQIIYGVLDLICNNQIIARSWSESWGHTKVIVHPDLNGSFCFMPRTSDFHKRGSKINTKTLMDPQILLDNRENFGSFGLLLNKRPMLIEGIILQVTRMLDELVWCRSQYLIKTQGVSSDLGYSLACHEIKKEGIRLSYVPESDILHVRKQDPQIPLRLYGDIHGKGTVPFIIGAVLKHDLQIKVQNHVDSSIVNSIYSDVLTKNKLSATKATQLPQKKVDIQLHTGVPVMCGITLTKHLHAGHLLLLSFGSLVQTCASSQYPLFLESNDTGVRVRKTIARISELTEHNIHKTCELLRQGKISTMLIEYAYQTRHLAKADVEKVVYDQNHKPEGPNDSLLFAMHQNVVAQLEECGFTPTQVITDSWACSDPSLPDLNSSNSILAKLGFSYLVTERVSHKKHLLVTKRQGEETASGARSKAVQYVSNLANNSKEVVYVDGDPSVQDASVILAASGEASLSHLQGAAIGFGLEVASGTNQKAPTIKDTLQELRPLLDKLSLKMSCVGRFFLLSRYATAKAIRVGNKLSSSQVGLHFFDYRSAIDFKQDLCICARECKTFLENANLLAEDLKKGSEDKKESSDANITVSRIIEKMRKALQHPTLGSVFPKSSPIKIDSAFRIIHNAIVSRAKFSSECAWDHICRAYLFGNKTLFEISRELSMNNIPYKRGQWVNDMTPRQLFYADTLLHSGYSAEEALSILPRYIYGDLCLLSLRCIYFDLINDIRTKSHVLTNTSVVLRRELEVGVLECIKRLGFEQ